MTTTTTTTTTTSLFRAAYEPILIMLLRIPVLIRIWLISLVGTNMWAFCRFPESLETQVIASSFILNVSIMTYFYQYHGGFTKLLGVMHAHWLVMIPWLVFWRFPLLDQDGSPEALDLKNMLIAVVAFDTICVIIDIRDVYQYLVLGMRDATAKWEPSTTPKKQQ